MGRPPKWLPEDIEAFKTKSVLELRKIYTDKSYQYLREIKRYYMERQPTQADRFRELLEKSGIDPNDIERVNELKAWQGFIKNSDGEIEYANLTSASLTPKGDNTVTYQAVPANITPSRYRGLKRNHKVIGVFGDTQIDYRYIDGQYVPIHDEQAMAVARLILKDVRPDIIVNLGDSVDLPEFSRFDKDSTHFNNHTLQRSFQRIHDYYSELRADHPKAHIHEVDSNHNTRLGKFVLKNIPDLWGFRPAGTPKDEWPMLTYPYMANLNAVDVEWHSGYDAAQYEYKPDLVFKHGKELRSQGSTADLLSKRYPYTNIVVGHGHKYQQHVRTTPDGKYLSAIQVGTLSKITGEVPGYGSAVDDMGYPVHRYQDQQQGILMIRDYGNGNYEFEPIYIRHGKAFYNGKEYDGNA